MLDALCTENEIAQTYLGSAVANAYVEKRFASELMRLLHERQVATVQRVFDLHRPKISLEIAPGPGRVTRDLRPTGRLVCLEFNEGMIDEGRGACRNGAEWVQGNAFELPFDDEFDLVYTFRFIRHFRRPDRNRLYEQIRRVLRPGGLLVVDAVNERVSAPLRRAAPDDYPIYDKLYGDEDELATEMREAGFAVERIEPVQRWFSLQSQAQILLGPRSTWLCRRAIRLLEQCRRGPALEWIATCRRV